MSLAVGLPPTTVRSMPVADPGELLTRLPEDQAFAWVREDDGLVAWGEFARLDVVGPDGLAQAAEWWAEQSAAMVVDDHVGLPGSGPVCFGSIAFDRRTGSSVFVIPRVVLGRRDGQSWLTTCGSDRSVPAPVRPPGPTAVAYSDGALSQAQWCAAVAEAVRRIAAGELDKVVLARDLYARTVPALDPRHLLGRLAERYPQCWTFAVDGLIGATPELLIRRTGRTISSLVLAGTVRRGDAAEDARLQAALVGSAKDQEEHGYSVDSVAGALAPFCRTLPATGPQEVLRLANVAHLATEVRGRLAEATPVLELVEALHPPAAVCGTPTAVALDLIPQLESMDRGRYTGPVGWMDSAGDGEWGIALRCARVDGDTVRLFAGCGIVAGSDPLAELAETQAKFVSVRDALEGR